MKITVLGASFNNDNLGVGALAMGIVTCITDSIPDAEISLLDYSRTPVSVDVVPDDRAISIATINLRMKPTAANNVVLLCLLALALRLLTVGRLRRFLICKHPVLRHVWNSDAVVSIAGGDSFSDIYGLRRFIDVSLPQLLVLLLGKKLLLLPQTIGPFKRTVTNIVAKLIMRGAQVVYARDELSLQLASQLLGAAHRQGKARLCHDVGFMLRPRRPERIDIHGLSLNRCDGVTLVGVNVSGLLFIGGYHGTDDLVSRSQYADFSHRLIEQVIDGSAARVLLIPHCLGDGIESDSRVCQLLFDHFSVRYPGRIGIVQGRYTSAEMKFIIGECDFFVGARMHACIAALSQCVPTVAVAYSRKFIGVLDTLGVGRLVVDPKQLETLGMLKVVGELFETRDEIREALKSALPQVMVRLSGLVREMLEVSVRPSAQLTGVDQRR